MMDNDFVGRNVIITGARRGIGRATVEHFAKSGANVWACIRCEDDGFVDEMECLAAQCGVWIQTVCFDLADIEAILRGVKTIMLQKLPVDVLVNNAGAVGSHMPMQMMPLSEMQQVMQINYFAPVMLAQVLSRVMARQRHGAIVNVASTAGLGASAGYGSYGASKAALMQTTKTLAAELASFGIRVNAVAPSAVETQMFGSLCESAQHNTLNAVALHRAADANEIAECIAFLASDRASFVTGQVLRVDGGV